MTHESFRTALHGRLAAISALVVVGLLTSACTSSSSSTAPSSPVTTATPPAGTAHGSMVDINTGATRPDPLIYAIAAFVAFGIVVLWLRKKRTTGTEVREEIR